MIESGPAVSCCFLGREGGKAGGREGGREGGKVGEKRQSQA